MEYFLLETGTSKFYYHLNVSLKKILVLVYTNYLINIKYAYTNDWIGLVKTITIIFHIQISKKILCPLNFASYSLFSFNFFQFRLRQIFYLPDQKNHVNIKIK